jgi:hypothetical protein
MTIIGVAGFDGLIIKVSIAAVSQNLPIEECISTGLILGFRTLGATTMD